MWSVPDSAGITAQTRIEPLNPSLQLRWHLSAWTVFKIWKLVWVFLGTGLWRVENLSCPAAVIPGIHDPVCSSMRPLGILQGSSGSAGCLLGSCSIKLEVPVLKWGWEFPPELDSWQWQQLQTDTEITPGCGGYTVILVIIHVLFEGVFSYHLSVRSIWITNIQHMGDLYCRIPSKVLYSNYFF